MGLTHVPVKLFANGKERNIDTLVDSGASYTVLPEPVWRDLDLKPRRSIRVQLADGTILRRPLSECLMEVEGESATSPVVLGDPGDLPLLGAISLETLGLVLNPFTRTLHPMRILLPTFAVSPGGLTSDN